MEAFTVLFILGMIVFVVWGIAHGTQQKQRKDQVLRELCKIVDGKLVEESVSGSIGDTTVTYRYTTRGSGKQTSYWTEVEAELPLKYPLRFHVRKHGWLDRGQIKGGELVDVIVGDPEFDDRFLVEAAPADIARSLLDERARSYLLKLVDKHWFEITTERVGQMRLKLSIRSWVDDLTEAETAVESMAAIAGRVRTAYFAVEKAVELRTDAGTPYRPMLDDSPARDAATVRQSEVARLDKLQTERVARQQMIAVIFVIGFVFMCILMFAAK